MFIRAKAWPVGVVVELDEVFAPPEEHRLSRAEQGVYRGEKQFRPLPDIADGSGAPIKGARPFGHLALPVDWAVERDAGVMWFRYFLQSPSQFPRGL